MDTLWYVRRLQQDQELLPHLTAFVALPADVGCTELGSGHKQGLVKK